MDKLQGMHQIYALFCTKLSSQIAASHVVVLQCRHISCYGSILT